MSFRKEFLISRFLIQSVYNELGADDYAYLSVHNNFTDSINSLTTSYLFSSSPPRRFTYQQCRRLPRTGRHSLDQIRAFIEVNYLAKIRIVVENDNTDSLANPITEVRIETDMMVFDDWSKKCDEDENADS